MARDYKDEYNKFQSSSKMKKKRAKFNQYNRDKGTYGNGDGLDASHGKGGKIIGFKSSSKNKGKKEKSRLKGSKRKKYQKGGKFKGPLHEEGGIPIEVEGDEIVINSTMNGAAIEHEDTLLALNENPDEWEIIPKNDARKRSKNHA